MPQFWPRSAQKEPKWPKNSPPSHFDPGEAKKARYRPKMDKMAELWLLVIFGHFWTMLALFGRSWAKIWDIPAKTHSQLCQNLSQDVL